MTITIKFITKSSNFFNKHLYISKLLFCCEIAKTQKLKKRKIDPEVTIHRRQKK